MNRLFPDSRLAECEEHLLICGDCQDRAASWDGFIAATKEALERVGTYLVHRTEDGPILIVPQRSGDEWTAALEGLQLWTMARGNTSEDAINLAVERFEQMFPEHQCTSDCGWRMRDS